MMTTGEPEQREREIPGGPGSWWAGIGVVWVLAGAALIVVGAGRQGGPSAALIVLGFLLVIFAVGAFKGLISVAPGQARVLQLFGRYAGTVRRPGLRCVNPLTVRKPVSTRIRNHETSILKVNDADGNPIEIAAVVVWQVLDTARATYDVEDFKTFVGIQTDTAVRHIANSHPYGGHGDDGRLSLQDNTEEITKKLSTEIAERVAPAGVRIVESRITQLAYAPEIAQAMLRRQQASAVIAARQQIVEGAVGMVSLALNRLEDGVVALDDERKAAMVSNLLVVLCSDQATQPVVNTGSLYQ